MKYGSNLKIIRKIKDYSPKKMAVTLNMSMTNYYKVENNKINLSEENLAKAAEELGVPIDTIKELPKDLLSFGHTNHQAENANFVVYPAPEKMVEMLQSTIGTLQEEILYLRSSNELLLNKLLHTH